MISRAPVTRGLTLDVVNPRVRILNAIIIRPRDVHRAEARIRVGCVVTIAFSGTRVDELRLYYQAKRTVMRQALDAELAGVLRWSPPRGGFFLWATVLSGLDADQLLMRAIQERVNYVAGKAFFVDGSGADTLRLCFSQATDEQIVEGVRRLARAIRNEMEGYGDGGDAGAGTTDAAGATSAVSGISAPRG